KLDNKNTKYDSYMCTQVMDDNEFLEEWLDFHLDVIGFKNICVINVGQPIWPNLTSKFNIVWMNKTARYQEFNLCRNCFEEIRPQDLLMVNDVDQYLNVRDSNYIYDNYDNYDGFYFADFKFGYKYEDTPDIVKHELLKTNVYRGPHPWLGEFHSKKLEELFNCSERGGWYSCGIASGKSMVKYGLATDFGVHYHKTPAQKTLWVDFKKIRLNHYCVRTKQNGQEKAKKWNKVDDIQGIIDMNKYFTMIYDDTIIESKRMR
ncbi:unnamed protein product, partial [Didymodactylos carnosus]